LETEKCLTKKELEGDGGYNYGMESCIIHALVSRASEARKMNTAGKYDWITIIQV
jgi:hypothetical protein